MWSEIKTQRRKLESSDWWELVMEGNGEGNFSYMVKDMRQMFGDKKVNEVSLYQVTHSK